MEEEDMSTTERTERRTSTAAALVDLADASMHEIKNIWEEMGTLADDRQRVIDLITKRVIEVYNNVLQNQQKEKAEVEKKISDLLASISHITTQLGVSRVEMSREVAELALLPRLRVIEAHATELEKRKIKREKELKEQCETLRSLAVDVLGYSESDAILDPLHDTDNLSKDRSERIQRAIEFLKTEKSKREATIHTLTVALINLWTELETSRTTFDDHVLAGKISPSLEVIASLERRKAGLEEEKRVLEEEFKKACIKLKELWDRLKVSEPERNAFFKHHTSLSPSVLRDVKREIARLEEVFAQSLKKLIQDARSNLVKLWDELHVSIPDRNKFVPYHSSVFSEALLEAHELEIKKLEIKVEQMRPINELIDQREKILRDKIDYEASISDPSRLLSKGPGTAGRLLREEHFRKQVLGKDLPKLEKKLLAELTFWEKNQGEPFTFAGQGSYLLRMQKQREEDVRRRAEGKRKRVNTTSTPEAGTPQGTLRIKSPFVGGSKTPGVPRGSVLSPLTNTIGRSGTGGTKRAMTPGPRITAKGKQKKEGSPPKKRRIGA